MNPSDMSGLPPIDDNENQDLKELRKKYKHRRMESKQQLVNHYNSLSLMRGDDPAQALKARKSVLDMVPIKDKGEDFDDISSIYTAKEQ